MKAHIVCIRRCLKSTNNIIPYYSRFSCDGAYRQKLNTFVEFPINGLDLTEYVESWKLDNKATHPYNLYAVSVRDYRFIV